MTTFLSRSLSLLVYLTYLAAAYAQGGGAATLGVAIGLLFPIACIWFAEPLGNYSGIIRGQLMTSSTPGFLVSAGGWLVLVGAPLIGYLLSKGI